MSCAKYLIALTFKHIYSLNLSNDLSKFADDIAIIAPVYDCEVQLGTGLEITADQRSMIGRKLFLIGEEATLPFILIGKKYI